jgi:hypothetical protein
MPQSLQNLRTPLAKLPTHFSWGTMSPLVGPLPTSQGILTSSPEASMAYLLEILLSHLDDEMCRRGYAKLYQPVALPNQSCYKCASKIGWVLDSVWGKQGYAASWLLEKIKMPAASPSHPQWSMLGSKGLMAPSPATQGVATPSTSLAQPSTQAFPTMPL